MSKVLFLHGLESKPGGTKAKYLEKLGHTVFNPHMPKSSFEESVTIAQSVIDSESPDVIVGSSRGGAVAMCVNTNGARLVLIAPAWSRFRQSENSTVSSKAMILHSRNDDIVEISDSRTLVENYGATLIEVGDNHRMSDPSALEAMADAVSWSLRKPVD